MSVRGSIWTNCFVPEENLLGKPGQFLGENWMGKINFAFTANYPRLGAGDVRLGARLTSATAAAARTPTASLRSGERKSMLATPRSLLALQRRSKCSGPTPMDAMVAAHERPSGWPKKPWKKSWSSRRSLRLDGVIRQTSRWSAFTATCICTTMHGRHDVAAQIVGASELGEPYDVNRTH